MTRPTSVLNGTRPRPLGGRALGEYLEPENPQDLAQSPVARPVARGNSVATAAPAPQPQPSALAHQDAGPPPSPAQPAPTSTPTPGSNPAATGRVVAWRGQDRYEPDADLLGWQDLIGPAPAPPDVAVPPRLAPVPAFTPAPSQGPAAAPSAAPSDTTINLETDQGSTQLLFSANQQAHVAPPPPQFTLTATAAAAATATTPPPPAAPYVGERPADATWLRAAKPPSLQFETTTKRNSRKPKPTPPA
jgi:hypothetical protein